MSGGLLGFRIRIVTENFQSIGKYDNLRHALYITVRRTMALLGRNLATSAVIRSKPRGFFETVFLHCKFNVARREMLACGKDRKEEIKITIYYVCVYRYFYIWVRRESFS